MRMKILSLFMVMTMMFTSLSSVTVFASTSPSDDAGTTTLRPIDATYVSQHGTDNETNYFGEGVMKINNTSHNSGSEDYG